jgi:Big-like domain-containing protein
MKLGLTLNRSYILAGMVALAILFTPITLSTSYAQTSISPSSQASPPGQQREHIVKITSPAKGQQVIIGNDLTISGTSSDNTTKNCSVSVIVNGNKPYHNAIGNGTGGEKDFSKWSIVLTPAYTNIKQGQNKITARFLCTNDPNLVTHNSVNVTGVPPSAPQSVSPAKQQATNVSATALLKNASIGSSTLETTSTGQPAASSSNNGSNNATNNTNTETSSNLSSGNGIGTGIGTRNESESGSTGDKIMSVSLHFSKKSVQPGDEQTVSVKVTNANSSSAISGATIFGSITGPSGGSFKKLEGTTDNTGKSSYSWTVSQNDATGKYKTVLDVSAPGYGNTTASKTFVIFPVTSPTNSDTTNFPNLSTGDRHSNSPSTIIPIPHIRIPFIKIPFHLPFH